MEQLCAALFVEGTGVPCVGLICPQKVKVVNSNDYTVESTKGEREEVAGKFDLHESK